MILDDKNSQPTEMKKRVMYLVKRRWLYLEATSPPAYSIFIWWQNIFKGGIVPSHCKCDNDDAVI